MHDWRKIMIEADHAKRQMMVEEAEGEALFKNLLERANMDGMIFYKRAEAYEALGKLDKAVEDFRKAMALFPMDRWKKAAREGLWRVENEIKKTS